MKVKDLRNGDIIAVETRWLGRPDVYYVVMENVSSYKRVAVAIKGNVNCEPLPSGWYDFSDGDRELPSGTFKVLRPKWFGNAFRGDFDNEEEYEVIFSRE